MSAPVSNLPVTVLVAAKNEAANIARCLASLQPAQRVVVLDSHSTDATVELSRRAGAEVVQFDYRGGYPKKRQWALDNLEFGTPWILLIDADECVPPALWGEIARVIRSTASANGFLITKGFHFLGRRFRFGGFSFPAVLLFRCGTARFERLVEDPADGLDMEVHERVIATGPVGRLKTPLVHEDFKGLEAYLDRHNKYSTWDAHLRHQFLVTGRWGEDSVTPRPFGNTQERRRFLKRIALRTPFEPQFWFLYHYVLRLGFLEGRPGLVASQIRSNHISQIRAKLYELQRRGESGPSARPRPMRVLLLNQCFYPDVVSTAQHLTDLAVGLAERGHAVRVLASRRGYDNLTVRFAKREVWKGIQITRVPGPGLGKAARWRRAIDFGSYMLNCTVRLAVVPRPDVVVALTSPPLISFLGALFTRARGGRFIFWVMDLNPDEAVAAGWLREGSLVARTLDRMLKYSLRHADRIIVLDRFMKERVVRKGIPTDKIAIIRPWSHDDVVRFDEAGRLSFRERHGLRDKFVVMYSGNHSPCHPLDTLLQAAERLKTHPKITFCFVGGGSEFKKVQTFASERGLNNIKCLPYQPLDQLAASLSSADLQVVAMGDAFPGIVHPCKIYNVLMVGSPVLVIGPEESHIGDILQAINCNGHAQVVSHGDVEAVVQQLTARAQTEVLARLQNQDLMAKHFSKSALLPQMIDVVESTTQGTM